MNVPVIPPHILIEIAFTVWGIKPQQAFIKKRGAVSTNIPKARHLAYYLMCKHTDLSAREMGEIFNDNRSTVDSGILAATKEIDYTFTSWKNQGMKDKFYQAMNIISKL